MSRVLALVEGQTEETFVRQMLAPAVRPLGVYLSVRLAKKRGHGGVPRWEAFRPDLIRLLKEDQTRFMTMMVDYYGMPADWPGRLDAKDLSYPQNVEHVEKEIASQVAEALDERFNPQRFIPYAQCHEYEALLFSDPPKVSAYLGQVGVAEKLAAIVAACGAPERVNDSPITAPSKRIVAVIKGYRKELYGTLLALEIGLPKLREKCPHFDAWVTKLVALAPTNP